MLLLLFLVGLGLGLGFAPVSVAGGFGSTAVLLRVCFPEGLRSFPRHANNQKMGSDPSQKKRYIPDRVKRLDMLGEKEKKKEGKRKRMRDRVDARALSSRPRAAQPNRNKSSPDLCENHVEQMVLRKLSSKANNVQRGARKQHPLST